MLKLDCSHVKLNQDLKDYQEKVDQLHQQIVEKTCLGNDYLGWYDWPVNYDKEELERVKEVGKEIRENADVLLVCGIGGSYLGARSAIEMLKGLYPDDSLEIVYTGNTVSSSHLYQTLKHIEGKSVYLNVISKSGTTTETAIAFRLFKNYIEEKYGIEESKKRIIATTDKQRGTLKQLSDENGYRTFVIPDDIGGRYSVITAVGLLPICAAGLDVESILRGCRKAREDFSTSDLDKNIAYKYALTRYLLHTQEKKDVEFLITYEPNITMFGEWWKQLFGESEGKDLKGILPASATFTTDLHSMGQFIQEGTKCFYETVLVVDQPKYDITFPSDEKNLDNMNYLASKSIDWVNKMAFEGTLAAHSEVGNNPNIVLHLEKNDEEHYGYLIYFFFVSCAMSVLLQGSNPFNQPGVEVYKKNMFKLLGKN